MSWIHNDCCSPLCPKHKLGFFNLSKSKWVIWTNTGFLRHLLHQQALWSFWWGEVCHEDRFFLQEALMKTKLTHFQSFEMKRYFQRSCSFSQSWQSTWRSSTQDFSFSFHTLHRTLTEALVWKKIGSKRWIKILSALNLEIWVQKRIPAPRSWVWVLSSAWVLLASSHGPKTWFCGAERVSVWVVCVLRGGYTHKPSTSSTSALLAASRTFPVKCSPRTSIAAPPETDRLSPTPAVPAPHNNNNDNNNNCWGQELSLESIHYFHMMLHFVFSFFCRIHMSDG